MIRYHLSCPRCAAPLGTPDQAFCAICGQAFGPPDMPLAGRFVETHSRRGSAIAANLGLTGTELAVWLVVTAISILGLAWFLITRTPLYVPYI